MAFGAAVAVLVRTALSVVCAASATLVVEIQRSAVKVLATTLIQSLDTGSGRGKRLGGAKHQLSLLVGEVTLFLGFAVARHGVGIPQTVGSAETAAAVTKKVACFIAFNSNALAILTSASGASALAVASASPALGRGECARSVQGARNIRATSSSPVATGLIGARLAVVVGARGRAGKSNGSSHGGSSEDHRGSSYGRRPGSRGNGKKTLSKLRC